MTPQQLAELQAEQALAQSLHAQRQANLFFAQHAQTLNNGGDRVVTNSMFAPAMEQTMSRMRVLDQRVRGAGSSVSNDYFGESKSDTHARPTHSLSETVFDYSQLLDGFQCPLTQISNRMKEESYLNTSTVGDRINRMGDSQALVSNLKELAEITTSLAWCIESVGFQNRSHTMVGGMNTAGMPSSLSGLPGIPPGMPSGMQAQPVPVQRRQQQELHAAHRAANVARAQHAQLAQAQVQAAQAAQAQARRNAQGDTGGGLPNAPGGQVYGPPPP